MELLSTYIDEHVYFTRSLANVQPDETLCCCAWTRDEATKDPLLAVAGRLGVVKVINTRHQKVITTFIGHGDVISLEAFSNR